MISDGFSVHHQELKTAYTASRICQTNILPAASLAGMEHPGQALSPYLELSWLEQERDLSS